MKKVLVLVGLLLIFFYIVGSNSAKVDKPSRAEAVSADTKPTPPTPQAVALPAPVEPGSQWKYRNDEDEMGRKRSFAVVESTNTVEFEFPYAGVQHGTLTVRRTPQAGTNVLIGIEKGQFLCGISDGCSVNVRFDEGPVQRNSASGPADHSTTVLFLNGESRLISQMRKAKVMRVEATFYQAGPRIFEFNVEGFKWGS
jgi:hypothetical protein